MSIDVIRAPDGREIWDCAVAIASHPARGRADDPTSLLGRAVASVYAQELLPRKICIAMDTERRGAGWCHQAALDEALSHGTEWVSFVDSDDFMYTKHLLTHRRLLCGPSGEEDLGDVAYSWFDGNDGIRIPWEPTHRGKAWDSNAKHHITMTITVRSSFARRSSFAGEDNPEWGGDDWRFICGLDELGARFVGTGDATWKYCVHGYNTSGSPEKGDARQ